MNRSGRRATSVLALGIAAATLAAGCASPPPASVDEVLHNATRAKQTSVYRVAVAPLEIDPAAALRLPSDETSCPVPVDLRAFESEVVRVVDGSRRFAGTVFLSALARREAREAASPMIGSPVSGAVRDSEASGAPSGQADETADEAGAGTAVYQTPAPVADHALFDLAFDEGADLILRLRTKRHQAHFVDHNGWYWLNQINFAVSIWPAYFVADEQYEGHIAVEAELLSVLNQKRIAIRMFDVKSGPKDLDHFDRGWLLLGSLVTPEWLGPQNYAQAGEIVLRHAQNRLDEELSTWLATVPLSRSAIQGKLAVCVGVGDYENRVQRAAVFSDDARTFASLLTGPAETPARNVRVLTEAQPTAEQVIAQLTESARRCGPEDSLIFYFAGFGFQSGDELFLVPSDVEPTNPTATAIPLSRIDAALRQARGRQIVVLDTSFGPADLLGEATPPVPVRTFTRAAGSSRELAPAGKTAQALLEAFAAAPRRTAILATAPGEAAHLVNADLDEQRAFFTARLATAVTNPATDKSGDRSIDLMEMVDFATYQTVRRTQATEIVQEPRVLGVPPKDVRMAPAAPVAGN